MERNQDDINREVSGEEADSEELDVSGEDIPDEDEFSESDLDEDSDLEEPKPTGTDSKTSKDSQYLLSRIKTKCESFDLAFYPKKDVFAVSFISGEVKLFEFTKNEKPKDLMQFDYHKMPCRAVGFTEDGNHLLSVAKDCKIHVIDMNKGTLSQTFKDAHSAPVNTIQIVTDNFFATGDDEGAVKLWDLRSSNSVAEFSDNTDFISDMALDGDKRHLVCTSGDGTLSVFNVKNRKKIDRSDQMDDELLSLAIIKDGKKIVCGGSEGALHIFSWGEWGDISDRFPDQPFSIDTICPVSDSLICTGSLDGAIRLVHIQPNHFVKQFGSHGHMPVLKIAQSCDGATLGSCSEEEIKLWNIQDCLEDIDLDEILSSKAAKGKGRKRKLEGASNETGFFDDL